MKAPFGSLDFDASSTCSMVVLAISQSVPGPFKYHQCIYKLYSITTYIIYTYVVYSMIWMLQANWYNGSTPFTLSPYITNPSPWLLSKTRRAPYNKFQQTWQNVLVVSCVWTPSGVGGGNRWREGCRNHVFWGSKNDELIWNTRIAQHHWVLVLIQQEICLYWWFWGMECNWLGLTWTWCSLQLCLTCRLSDKSVHLKCIEKNTNWKGMPSLYYRQRPTFSHLYPKLQI